MNKKLCFENLKMKYNPNIFHMIMWINIMLLLNLWASFFRINKVVANILIYLSPIAYSVLMELWLRVFPKEENEDNNLILKISSVSLLVLVSLLYTLNIMKLNLFTM